MTALPGGVPTDPEAVAPRPWYLYLLRCRNGALYAGITNDVAARYAVHVARRGARYTRANPPEQLVGSIAYPDRGSAARAEHAIRKLAPAAKVLAIQRGCL